MNTLPSSNTLLADAELLLAQEGQALKSDTLDAVVAQPGVYIDGRYSQAKAALLATSPDLDLMLAPDGTELSEYQLDAVTAQPGVNKDALMQKTRTVALAALKKVA